jgi:5-methyltetrahydrofolate--homocysteine methyltransferase
MSEYEGLVTAVQQGDFTEAQNLVSALLNQGKSPDEIIREGIVVALDIVGKRFSAGECYIPEMLVAARASQRGLDVLTPLLVKTGFKPRGKVVIGTVRGDLHDIGKNIVAMMLKGVGFHVVDLGFDVGPEKFVNSLKTENAQILAMSCLLTTTMISMQETIDALREAGLYGKVKVMIGGPPTTDDFAQEIGADFRGKDAYEGVEQAKRFSTIR